MIFPITRNNQNSIEKWETVLRFFEKSEIQTLLVIDKTELGTAKDYFMREFQLNNKCLIVLPRSVDETLFGTVGEIELDDEMWVIQLHDDDTWKGVISLPNEPNRETVYFSDFYLDSNSKGSAQIFDFSLPNRIVFSLVPTMIWNRFSSLVQDQKHHVAGSFDYTLNNMARLACKFEYQPGFKYYWRDDNWGSRKESVAHLTELAVRDGWNYWASPEIANLNRTIDTLASLHYLQGFLDPKVLQNCVKQSINQLEPGKKRKIKFGILIPILTAITGGVRLLTFQKKNENMAIVKLERKLNVYRLIRKTWQIDSIKALISMVIYIESLDKFDSLQDRFRFWRHTLSELEKGL